MPSYPIEYKDIEGVITGWKLHESPYWSLWSGTTLKCVCAKEDMDASEELLRETLEAMQASGYDGIWKIQIHDDAKKLTSKKEYKGSFNFQLNDRGQFTGAGQAPGAAPNLFVVPGNGRQSADQLNPMMELMQKMVANQEQLNQRLLAIEEEEEYDDDEDDEPEDTPEQRIERTVGMISGVLDRFQPHIAMLIDKLTAPRGQQQQPQDYQPQNIGEMPQQTMTPEELNAKLHAAIQTLEQKIGGEKLIQALEKLAAMDKLKLQGMLMML